MSVAPVTVTRVWYHPMVWSHCRCQNNDVNGRPRMWKRVYDVLGTTLTALSISYLVMPFVVRAAVDDDPRLHQPVFSCPLCSTAFQLSLFVVLQALGWANSLVALSNFHYAGHIILALCYLPVSLIKPPSATRTKQKAQ